METAKIPIIDYLNSLSPLQLKHLILKANEMRERLDNEEKVLLWSLGDKHTNYAFVENHNYDLLPILFYQYIQERKQKRSMDFYDKSVFITPVRVPISEFKKNYASIVKTPANTTVCNCCLISDSDKQLAQPEKTRGVK